MHEDFFGINRTTWVLLIIALVVILFFVPVLSLLASNIPFVKSIFSYIGSNENSPLPFLFSYFGWETPSSILIISIIIALVIVIMLQPYVSKYFEKPFTISTTKSDPLPIEKGKDQKEEVRVINNLKWVLRYSKGDDTPLVFGPYCKKCDHYLSEKTDFMFFKHYYCKNCKCNYSRKETREETEGDLINDFKAEKRKSNKKTLT
ncbi:MAG: hypothetical protein WC356_04395 [Candidatus Micrarchaeia archaeon]